MRTTESHCGSLVPQQLHEVTLSHTQSPLRLASKSVLARTEQQAAYLARLKRVERLSNLESHLVPCAASRAVHQVPILRKTLGTLRHKSLLLQATDPHSDSTAQKPQQAWGF